MFVSSVTTSTLTIEPPLDTDFDSSSLVAIQHIPHYEDVDIDSSASVSTSSWTDGGTAIVAFRATGDITLDGDVDVTGLGFEGGYGVYGNSYSPMQGESWGGTGTSGDTSANEGGGGAYPRRDDNGDSGGGGGFGTPGDDGTAENGSAVTSGGDTYGDDELFELFLGSGGGGGSPDKEADGNHINNYSGSGGNGGGIVLISAGGTFTINGFILADGDDGDDAYSPWYSTGENGGGGAGSGGTIYLAAPNLTINGTVSAEGEAAEAPPRTMQALHMDRHSGVMAVTEEFVWTQTPSAAPPVPVLGIGVAGEIEPPRVLKRASDCTSFNTFENVIPQRVGHTVFAIGVSWAEVVQQMVLLYFLENRVFPFEMVNGVMTSGHRPRIQRKNHPSEYQTRSVQRPLEKTARTAPPKSNPWLEASPIGTCLGPSHGAPHEE